MRSETRRLVGPILLTLWIAAGSVGAAAPSERVVAQVFRSIVTVKATSCSGGDRQATGFFWKSPTRVVTALHAVAGCGNVTIRSIDAGALRVARMVKVLQSADLALLEVDGQPLEIPPLATAVQSVGVDQMLKAVGFSLSAPTPSDTSLRVASGSKILSEMLAEPVRDQIRKAGSPSLTLAVLRLEGHLLPGLSGAPIIDERGHVAGIGDGGLEGGAASISFGIPARHLLELEASKESPAVAVGLSVAHFSADLEPGSSEYVDCGRVRFRRARTRTFEELVSTSDDPRGAYQLLASAPTADPTTLRFDIYEDDTWGAAVVVPMGVQLQPNGGHCLATAANGQIHTKVGGAFVSAPIQAQQQSVDFEDFIRGSYPSYFFQVNPAFSYWSPVHRPDGLVAMRKAALGYSQMDGRYALLFETLMTRGTAFVGVAALNGLYHPSVDYPGCQTPHCQQYASIRETWIATVIGIHLSTFPPY